MSNDVLCVLVHNEGFYVGRTISGVWWHKRLPGEPRYVSAAPRAAWGELPPDSRLIEVASPSARRGNFDPRFFDIPLEDAQAALRMEGVP